MNNQEAKSYGVSSLRATSVKIRGKNLTRIPEFVFNMPNLEVLNLSDNRIESIPEKIGKLKNLQELTMNYNALRSLPSSMGSLTKLELLSLYNNELTTLPSSMEKLKNLSSMYLTNNKLTSIPALPPKLTLLDLKVNSLTSVPEAITKHGALKYLFVGENKLTTLPESIGDVKSLETLGLANNRLARLPERIGDLTNLLVLNIDGNPIVSVPASMGKLSKKSVVQFNGQFYRLHTFLEKFKPKVVRTKPVRVTNATNIFNGSIMEARLSNIPPNKRAFINNASNVKNNGTLRRIYNVNGLKGYMKDKRSGRLHGGNFTANKITLLKNVPFTVNKSAYLRNIRDRLSNTPMNNMLRAINGIKSQLPTNVNRNDVNKMAKNAARIKVRNTNAANRTRVANALRAKGLLTNEDKKN
jgi:Leucine-rich repeat (LRR) protein